MDIHAYNTHTQFFKEFLNLCDYWTNNVENNDVEVCKKKNLMI